MSSRPKRRTVLRKTALPDATHYVGYVEDDETPEMIMRKFEEMERIKAAAVGSKRTNETTPTPATSQDEAGPSASNHASAIEDLDQLDQEQLYEVFKATSMYNVKSLLSNNEALMASGRTQQDRYSQMPDNAGHASGQDDDLVEELRGFWSDDDWSKANKRPRQRIGRASGSKSTEGRRQRTLQRNQRTCMIAHYNRDTHAFIRRRMRVVDPDAILQLRIPPPPLPLSWGRAIKPYRPRVIQQHTAAPTAATEQATEQPAPPAAAPPQGGLLSLPLPASRNCDPASTSDSSCTVAGESLPVTGCQVHTTPDITRFAFESLRQQHYLAVLINTGWEVRPQLQQQQQQQQQHKLCSGVLSWSEAAQPSGPSLPCSSSSKAEVVQRLASLPMPSLCPRGFVFIWVNKEHLSAVVTLMSSWGFTYVENLTWVLLHPNHSVLRLPSQFIKRSHITLYIFRREGEGRDIELRHQRNPDVVFDCVRAVEGREWDVPAEVFTTIETLLPTGKGAFLEMWAPEQSGRAGWTHLVETAASSQTQS